MNFPLKLSFKLLALAPQISVTDAAEQEVMYVQQKLFKLKEHVQVYRNAAKTEVVYEIRADRAIDFQANYSFTETATGQVLGGVRREGMKSLWRATYEVTDGEGRPVFTFTEENPWVKVLDGLLDQVPGLNLVSGFFLNPAYVVTDIESGQVVLRAVKHRSMFESTFTLDPVGSPPTDEAALRVTLALVMMTLLERDRG